MPTRSAHLCYRGNVLEETIVNADTHAGRVGARARPGVRLHRAAIALILVLVGAVQAAPDAARAAVDTSARTAAEIRAKWQLLRPTYGGGPYALLPRSKAPYAAGVLRTSFLNDGLKMLRYCRYVAGLPYGVGLYAKYVSYAQHASVLDAAWGRLDHTPARPVGMSLSFYQLGYKGTSSSNLAAGFPDLESTVLAYMSDSDTTNIDRVGHRRWILSPLMARTGMGYANGFSATYAFDRSGSTPGWKLIRWPCAGWFPLPLMGGSTTAWSVSLNPAKYRLAPQQITVRLRRLSDGGVWTFDSGDTDRVGAYLAVNTDSYGYAPCIIFRPEPGSISYRRGAQYEVTIRGGVFTVASGTPVTIRYRTRFLSL